MAMNPFSFWTDLTLKLWGFGKPADSEVTVAVIPTKDAKVKQRGKAKAKSKAKAKRAKR
jgi:hypothetical protein